VTLASYVPLVGEPAGQAGGLEGGGLRAADVRRVIAFVYANPVVRYHGPFGINVDSMQHNLRGARLASEMLTAFVERQMAPRDLVAIVRAHGPRETLRQFTADKTALRAAIRDIRDNPANPGDPEVTVVHLAPGTPPNLSDLVRENLRIVEVASRVVARLGRLPGRKMLFLVAAGLSIGREFESTRDALRRLGSDANAAGVTIYGINPRGLGAAAATVDVERQRPLPAGMPIGGMAAPDQALELVAYETGGRAVFNTNNLGGNLDRILQENAGYYLLGYESTDAAGGRPGKVRIHVRRQGLRVSARPEGRTATALAAAPVARAGGLVDLLNSPLSHAGLGVTLRPYLRFVDARQAKLLLAVEVAPEGVDFQPGADGMLTADLAVLTRVLDEKGKAVHLDDKAISIRLKESEPRPVSFVLEQPLTAPGFYRADVVVRDRRSERAGNASASVERRTPRRNELVLSDALLRAADSPTAPPGAAFPSGANLSLSWQVARPAASSAPSPVRVQLQLRVKRGDSVVREDPAEVLEQQLPDPFDLDARLSLAGLAPGDYTVELELADLVDGKARALARAPLRVFEK
jgi:VWFA-related protein